MHSHGHDREERLPGIPQGGTLEDAGAGGEQARHIHEIEELLESGNPGGEGSPPRDAPTAGTAAEPDKAGETAAPAATEQTGETNNPGETGRFLSPCTKGRQEESVE